MLAMSELRQRRVDLDMTFDEFHTVWMLQKLKKRRKMESFELQALREVVKDNGQTVVQNFERKFKEICVEGKRKSLKESTTLYTEKPPPTYYTEAEQEHIEVMYMETESEARKRFNNSRSRSQTRNQSQNERARSYSTSRYNPNNRYDPGPKARLDRFKEDQNPLIMIDCEQETLKPQSDSPTVSKESFKTLMATAANSDFKFPQ